jgi:hypothetical protein
VLAHHRGEFVKLLAPPPAETGWLIKTRQNRLEDLVKAVCGGKGGTWRTCAKGYY